MHRSWVRRPLGWSCCSWSSVKTWLPILSWFPGYKVKYLQMDVLAGLTVGLTVVPQALAYAEVAGLPVQYGLYSAFMGGFIYTILGTSKDVTLGPTAIMSLLCFSVVGGQPHRAVLLSLLCGLIQAAMALLRLGFLLDFISYPVTKGFTCAAAVTIGFGQVKNILGIQEVPHQFFLEVYYTFYKIPEARTGDVVMGLLCLCLLTMLTFMKSSLLSNDSTLCSRMARKFIWTVATSQDLCVTDADVLKGAFPVLSGLSSSSWSVRNALLVVAASLFAFSCEAYGHHFFTITGHTSQGLPPFRPPPTSDTTSNGTTVSFGEMLMDFGGGLALIPLMGLLESIAIAKAFASQNDYRIDANQELLAIGVTNIMGSFVSAYPVTGSFGRTAVNSQTGVCTPAGGILTSVIVLLSLEFLMPAFYYIPKASLAAVIICAVAPMLDYGAVARMWNVHRLDLLPFAVTFLMSFWQVQYGIMAGVAVSGAGLLYNMARPRIKVSDHGVLVMQLCSGLTFPATEHLSRFIHAHALQVSPTRSVVLDCHHVSAIDYTVISELKDLLRQFQLRRVRLVFSGLKPSILKVFLAAQLQDFMFADSVEEALQMESGSSEPLLGSD